MSEPGSTSSSAAALVTYQLGGRRYPLKTNGNCKVCMSDYRFEVEAQIIKGRVYRSIVASLPDGANLTKENVMNHYRHGHMPLDVEVQRRTIEKFAKQRGKNVEDDIDGIVDGLTLAALVVQKAFEQVASGEIVPDLKEGLFAAKMLETFGVSPESGLNEQDYVQAFLAYQEEARATMTPAQFEQFGQRLNANPTMRNLISKQQQHESGVALEEDESIIVVYEDEVVSPELLTVAPTEDRSILREEPPPTKETP